MSEETQEKPPIIKIVGRSESAKAYAIRDFLNRGDMPFEWVELKTDEQARQFGVNGLNDPRLPISICPDGNRMENPTIRQIAEQLNAEGFHTPMGRGRIKVPMVNRLLQLRGIVPNERAHDEMLDRLSVSVTVMRQQASSVFPNRM